MVSKVSNSPAKQSTAVSRERGTERSTLRRLRQSHLELARRWRQISSLLRTGGAREVSDRTRKAIANWLTPTRVVPPVRPADVMAVDLDRPFTPPALAIENGRPVLVNWVITPPSPGSGGHTTLFRIIRFLEAHGYRNRVYFYDAYSSDLLHYESIVRDYYGFNGSIGNVHLGMEDAHAVFATGWPTAYAVFNARCAGKRFYFIQDFEPYFYPVGSTSALAECTYRMGFHGISIGSCYADKLRSQYGMTVETFLYGCDVSQYRRIPESARSGIVFYARRDNARRGLELGLMALELFAARRPEIEIHVYGDKLGKQPFAYRDHGRVSPEQLNAIYNRCFAGLSLSFTNVSLVALEMLAAGCIPVVNDTSEVRTDLKSEFVSYAAPFPQALCDQLEAVLDNSHFEALSAAAASSVHSTTWDEAALSFEVVVRGAIHAPANCS